MVDIYHCMISKELTAGQWEKYFSFLPAVQKDKNRRFKNWEDRHAHLFGRLLLWKGLINKGYEEHILDRIQTTDFDKPYIEGAVNFNISHSNSYVICAVGGPAALGIDIEKKDPQFNFSHTLDILCKAEHDHVFNSADRTAAFFRIWARKESLIKANGKGFSLPLNQINCLPAEVILENKTWHIQDIDFDQNYSVSLSTTVKNPLIHYFVSDFYAD